MDSASASVAGVDSLTGVGAVPGVAGSMNGVVGTGSAGVVDSVAAGGVVSSAAGVGVSVLGWVNVGASFGGVSP
jgi:hypothetical protein